MHKLYVNSPYPPRIQDDTAWSWPVDPSRYDRFSGLRTDEKSALAYLVARQRRCGHFPPWVKKSLHRLIKPIDDVMTTIPRTQAATWRNLDRLNPRNAPATHSLLGMDTGRMARDLLLFDKGLSPEISHCDDFQSTHSYGRHVSPESIRWLPRCRND